MGEEEQDEDKTIIERNKFFATTSLSGFGLIHVTNHRLEVAFWYIVIVVFAYITIKQLIDLTTQYNEGSTVTSVSIDKLPSEYYMAPIETKLQLTLPELHPEFKSQLFPHPYNNSLSQQVDEALETLNTRFKFIYSDWNGQYVLLPLLTRYAQFMSTCEIHNDLCKPDLMRQSESFEAMMSSDLEPVRREILKILTHTRALGIRDAALMQKLGQQILLFVKFEIRDPKRNFRASEARRSNPVWQYRLLNIQAGKVPGSVVAAFELSRIAPLPIYEEESTPLMFLVSMDRLKNLLQQSKVLGTLDDKQTRQWIRYSNMAPAVTLKFGQTGVTRPQAQIDQTTQWKTKIDFTYLAYKDCVNSSFTWISDCIWESLLKECGCWPLFVRVSPQTHAQSEDYHYTEFCTYYNYTQCMDNADTQPHAQRCALASPRQCDRDFYIVEKDKNAVESENSANILLQVLNSERPIFQEEPAQSFTSFLAEIVYLFKNVGYAATPKTKTGSKMRHTQDQHSQVSHMMTSLTWGIAAQGAAKKEKDDLEQRVAELEKKIMQLERK